jgi:hypothetical protein
MDTFKPRLVGDLPEGWLAKESITFLAPDGHSNVIASSEPLDPVVDSKTYADAQGEALGKEFPGYQEISLGTDKVFGGYEGYVRKFHWTPPEGSPVTQIQLYYVEDGRGYTATATTSWPSPPEHERELARILDALRLE